MAKKTQKRFYKRTTPGAVWKKDKVIIMFAAAFAVVGFGAYKFINYNDASASGYGVQMSPLGKIDTIPALAYENDPDGDTVRGLEAEGCLRVPYSAPLELVVRLKTKSPSVVTREWYSGKGFVAYGSKEQVQDLRKYGPPFNTAKMYRENLIVMAYGKGSPFASWIGGNETFIPGTGGYDMTNVRFLPIKKKLDVFDPVQPGSFGSSLGMRKRKTIPSNQDAYINWGFVNGAAFAQSTPIKVSDIPMCTSYDIPEAGPDKDTSNESSVPAPPSTSPKGNGVKKQ